jgi:Domain of unknown function (DUF4386)
MNNNRKHSLGAGILYLITFVSIPTLALYSHVHELNYIVGPGPDTPVILGGILEIIVALAGIGTAVALYPVVKRQNGGVALGLVGSRVLEAGTMFAGVASLLALVTLRKAGVGADAVVTGQALVALYDGLFRIGQSLLPAVNGLLLGYLMYKSRLVPRALPLLGFIGAAVLAAATTSIMFGIMLPAGLLLISTLPIAVWEFSLGVWLTVRGFNKSAIASLFEKTETI